MERKSSANLKGVKAFFVSADESLPVLHAIGSHLFEHNEEPLAEFPATGSFLEDSNKASLIPSMHLLGS